VAALISRGATWLALAPLVIAGLTVALMPTLA
jgi:hypothetical protein